MSNGNGPLTVASGQAACITGAPIQLHASHKPARWRLAAAVPAAAQPQRVTTRAAGNAPRAAAPTTSNS
jgi:hypothetical protein